MRMAIIAAGLLGAAWLMASWQDTAADTQAAGKAFGLDKRIPWTTSKVIGSPDRRARQ